MKLEIVAGVEGLQTANRRRTFSFGPALTLSYCERGRLKELSSCVERSLTSQAVRYECLVTLTPNGPWLIPFSQDLLQNRCYFLGGHAVSFEVQVNLIRCVCFRIDPASCVDVADLGILQPRTTPSITVECAPLNGRRQRICANG